MEFTIPAINLSAILPEILMTILASAVLIADFYIPEDKKEQLGMLSIGGLIITFIISLNLFGKNISVFNGMFFVDGYAVFFKLAFTVISIIVISISLTYIKIKGINMGEYYALILFSTLGMMIMAGGGDLITIYLGLELMALSSYVLVGIMKNDSKSIEASLKYFLTGAFISGILLYGIALLYGVTGTTNITQIADFLSKTQLTSNPLLILSLIMLTAGLGFKIAAVPFHIWAPDVYEGAPTSITAFLTVGSKFAGFAALIRIYMTALVSLKPYWSIILSILAIFTMFIGNIIAIYQSNVKRMLAYSSIAHAGYILVGVAAANKTGIAGVLFYAIAYTFMNIGTFSILILLEKKGSRLDDIDSFKGIAQTNPYVAFTLLIFLLSLAGIPPTAGFIGKFYIFSAAIEARLICVAVLGVLSSVISVYYYLRVVMAMYMEEPIGDFVISPPISLIIVLSIMAFAVIAIGAYPGPFIEAAKASVFL